MLALIGHVKSFGFILVAVDNHGSVLSRGMMFSNLCFKKDYSGCL